MSFVFVDFVLALTFNLANPKHVCVVKSQLTSQICSILQCYLNCKCTVNYWLLVALLLQ